MTPLLRRAVIVTVALAGMAVFFLAPVIPVQAGYSIPADPYSARHCGIRAYNYTYTEFRSLGYHFLGFGYHYLRYTHYTDACL